MPTAQHPLRIVLAICVACALLLTVSTGQAQSDIEKTLRQYSADDVKGYIQPFGDLLGADINAGLFHGAAIDRASFHLKFELVAMASMVGDAQKVYTANAPANFNPATFETPTIFGDKGATVTDTRTGFTYRGSDGLLTTTYIPAVAPQLTLGDLYGTRLAVRYLATPELDEGKLPKAQLFGLGVQHSVSQYLPDSPVDVAAHVFYNRFNFGDLIKLTGTSIGLDASKTFSVLTLYTGLAWEKSTFNVSYASELAGAPGVSVDIDGANKFRFNVGLQLSLGFLHLFGDANFGTITNYSAGIGFGG